MYIYKALKNVVQLPRDATCRIRATWRTWESCYSSDYIPVHLTRPRTSRCSTLRGALVLDKYVLYRLLYTHWNYPIYGGEVQVLRQFPKHAETMQ